jgi:hypothetical protein
MKNSRRWRVQRIEKVIKLEGTAPDALLGLFRYPAKQAKFLWSVMHHAILISYSRGSR